MDEGYPKQRPPTEYSPMIQDTVADRFVDYRLRGLFFNTLAIYFSFAVFIVVSFALLPMSIAIVLCFGVHVIVMGFQTSWHYSHNCELVRLGSNELFSLIYVGCLIRDKDMNPDECWKMSERTVTESYWEGMTRFDPYGMRGLPLNLAKNLVGSILMIAALGWVGIQIGERIRPWLG